MSEKGIMQQEFDELQEAANALESAFNDFDQALRNTAPQMHERWKATISFDRTTNETPAHFKNRVKNSLANIRKHGYTAKQLSSTPNKVLIQAPLPAASYITPKIID